MEYRGYKIESILQGPPGYRIRGIGSGDIPTDLKGQFTTTKFACTTIDRYEDNRPKESILLQDHEKYPPRKTKEATPRAD